jgi:hypothetical protein
MKGLLWLLACTVTVVRHFCLRVKQSEVVDFTISLSLHPNQLSALLSLMKFTISLVHVFFRGHEVVFDNFVLIGGGADGVSPASCITLEAT